MAQNCFDIETLLALHCGELPEADATQARIHITSCVRCNQKLTQLYQAAKVTGRLLGLESAVESADESITPEKAPDLLYERLRQHNMLRVLPAILAPVLLAFKLRVTAHGTRSTLQSFELKASSERFDAVIKIGSQRGIWLLVAPKKESITHLFVTVTNFSSAEDITWSETPIGIEMKRSGKSFELLLGTLEPSLSVDKAHQSLTQAFSEVLLEPRRRQ